MPGHPLVSVIGQRERPAVGHAFHPVFLQESLQKSRAELSAQVRLSCAPVQTRAGKPTACRRWGKSDTDVSQCRLSLGGERVCRCLEPSRGDQPIVQRDRDRPCHMVVAGTGKAQFGRRATGNGFGSFGSQSHQRFERMRHPWAGKAEIAIPSLRQTIDQTLFAQTGQMAAGR